jgi:hypothetical protein
MIITREKSSQNANSFRVLRDEKAGAPGNCIAIFGVEYRQVCLISRRRSL